MSELIFPIDVSAPAGRSAPHSLNYRLGRLVLKRYAWGFALILTLALLNCFWRLSTNAISDLDEARYGVAASEMLRNHSALVATYGGRPEYWNLKPPLGYWMQELSFRAFGPTVFALRFPAALCALVVIALTMSFCKRWHGRRAALLSGLMLTTCFGLVGHHGSRTGDLDSALTLIMLVAMIQVPRLAQFGGARLLWAGMLAIGFLLKSFAILPFAAITTLYLLWSGDWRRSSMVDWLPAMALLSGIVLTWALARYWVDGSMYFVRRMIHEDLLERSTHTMDSETYKPWGYLAVLLDRFAPWPLFILACVMYGGHRIATQTNGARLVWLWALVPLLAFSLVRTQHHWYLDPTYPAWSILAATSSLNLMVLSSARRHLFVASLLVLGILFCEARILLRVFRTDRRPEAQAFLLSLHDRLRLPSDTIVVATFPLSHSERFILQVVDGYRINEPDLSEARNLGSTANHTLLLARRQQAAVVHAEYPKAELLMAGAGYLVLQSPPPESQSITAR